VGAKALTPLKGGGQLERLINTIKIQNSSAQYCSKRRLQHKVFKGFFDEKTRGS
jgi:hypothetical protein